jgi:diguanylate cyclase (GGDEF)-like protein/PAS domain S-box-containing protein
MLKDLSISPALMHRQRRSDAWAMRGAMGPIRTATWPKMSPALATGAAVFAVAMGTLLAAGAGQRLVLIWLINGIVLVRMLPLKGQERAWHAAAGCVGLAAAMRLVGMEWPGTLLLTGANVAEVGLMLWVTGHRYDERTAMVRMPALRFTAWSVVAVGLYAAIAGLLKTEATASGELELAAMRMLGHELGLLVVMAVSGLIRRRMLQQLFSESERFVTTVSLAALAAATMIVFSQDWFTPIYVLVTVMILMVFRGGLALGMLGLMVTIPISAGFTFLGHGPFGVVGSNPIEVRVLMLQVFLLVAFSTVYPIGRELAARERLENLYNTLQMNARVIVTRSTLDGERVYVSPSVKAVLGWSPQEMKGDARGLIHPEDRPAVDELLETLKSGRDSEIFTYRSKCKSGGYVWLEAQVQVVRDTVTGEPLELITTQMDISERKETEVELQKAYDNLERLAAMDGLTGLANRRIFDETLEAEWRRAQREESTLSMLMLDVDYFKSFNDALGHVAGDETLRQIAGALREVVHRPGDLAARYGGEEFVVLLPVTDSEGAMHIARKVAIAISRLGMEHVASPAGYVTASIGVTSFAPGPDAESSDLVEAADRAMYSAKRKGRNRIEMGVMVAEDVGQTA